MTSTGAAAASTAAAAAASAAAFAFTPVGGGSAAAGLSRSWDGVARARVASPELSDITPRATAGDTCSSPRTCS